MKLNNKGFAISSVMYTLLILAVSLMFGILAVLISRKISLDNVKNNVKGKVNGDIIQTPLIYKGIPDAIYKPGDSVSYAGLNWQVIVDNGNSTTVVLADYVNLNLSTLKFSNYQTALNEWLMSNSILNQAAANNYILSMSFSDSNTTYNGYVRTLTTQDIYGTTALPTNLSLTSSIITDCPFCVANYNYLLLTMNGANNYVVKYDNSYIVNYLSSASTGNYYVRPVITILEYEV